MFTYHIVKFTMTEKGQRAGSLRIEKKSEKPFFIFILNV
jgi:hypothetical protein